MLATLFWATLFAVPSRAQSQFVKGQKWQIVLTGVPDVSKSPLPPTDAPVWDIDLFDSDAATIMALKATGKIVICYFSAGTVEDWRSDAKDFPVGDVGKVLPEWPNEKWIRTGSTRIRDIMAKRIKLAGDKGCDAIDPDNIDPQQNDNGLNLQPGDAIAYMQWMATEAAKHSMEIGLKNALDIVDALTPTLSFAVNEQCAQLSECDRYAAFLAAGKPVFHVEYPTPLDAAAARGVGCTGPGTAGMSSVLKRLALDGLAVYCDGSVVDTPTKGGTGPPRPTRTLTPRPTTTTRPSTTRPTTTTRQSTTPAPPPTTTTTTTTTARTTSTRPPPTSTSGPGNGCKSKHWDQCGGNDWKGCTICESPYTCKGVSPPWYYQCL
ncbi:endo alpha-1,4 polygalactosaminidase precursor [Paraphaeosphaeria minitans]|uniref:alpha-galactosidase n=1 Tax=Paraphaeosphaeria minitans TaxID=565426 RepID=A0A9P6GIL9_9PLEO|nr:endo alpha-1,4 polygalactosaminidase precursor [Paraphaeosphaeria minitans]